MKSAVAGHTSGPWGELRLFDPDVSGKCGQRQGAIKDQPVITTHVYVYFLRKFASLTSFLESK